MFAIFKREVRSCFHGMIGYVLTAFLLVASAIYFVALNLATACRILATIRCTTPFLCCCSIFRC
mgnify:FL=1